MVGERRLAFGFLLAAACTEQPAAHVVDSTTGTGSTSIVQSIDHFFATSHSTEPLYRVFRDSLGLPEVYPFRNYGNFASGVVSMGNVLFEVVTWDVETGDTLLTEFKGIAFAPSDSLPVTLALMRERGLPAQVPESVTSTGPDGTKTLGYVNVPLDGPGGLPPTSASIFINDNLGSPQAATRRRDGAKELVRRGGGALGVVEVRELIIGVERRRTALAEWRRLLGSATPVSDDVVTLTAGPAMRFVETPSAGILEMVVRVRSLADAERFLVSKGISRRDGERLFIDPAAVGGLRIRLVE